MSASSVLPPEVWDNVFDQYDIREGMVSLPKLEDLPPEILELILDGLTDPKDLLSCIKVCTTWEMILQRRKNAYLFSMVLPMLVPYLNRNDLLMCCQTSSSWNIAIDDFNYAASETDVAHGIKLHLDYGKITKFLKTIHRQPPAAPVNVAMFRHVTFHYNTEFENLTRRYPGYFDADTAAGIIAQYLGRCGRWIRHLEVILDGVCLVVVLHRWLRLTPNVTMLKVQGHGGWPNELGPIERFPLPDLPQLNHLIYICGYEECLNWLLHQYGAQLVTLELHNSNAYPGSVVPYDGATLPRLRNLTLYFERNAHIARWWSFFQRQKVPLKQLTITHEWRVDHYTAQETVNFINIFHETLEDLSLEYYSRYPRLLQYRMGDKSEGLQGLRLPQLKAINFTGVGLPTAEMLYDVAPGLSKVRLSFLGRCENDSYKKLYDETPFWNMLPSMKSVSVGLVLEPGHDNGVHSVYLFLYTRATYEYIVAKKEKDESWCYVPNIPPTNSN